jgi:hypothetical protein
MKLLVTALALLGLALWPARACATEVSAYQARASQLLAILSAPGGEDDFFSTLFLDAVPVEQWRALAADLRAQHGKPVARGAVQVESPTTGVVEIRYERATVGFTLVVAPQAPGRVIGLQLVGTRQNSDNMDKVLAEIASLPGHAALAIARLDAAGPVWLHGHRADTLMATGSSFKLYILAELARAVAAGERRWSDVIPLSHKSFSGRLLTTPNEAPMTLHSLALAMVAESDNSAADTLMLSLGRMRVNAMVRASGHARPDATLPLLTTAEAFALKMPANADLARRYAAATPDQRLALIAADATRLTAGAVDIGTVAEIPTAIDSIEWFATPQDMVRLLDWLRRNGGDALPIMTVNPGIAPADAKRWRNLAYKGGSEPGVIAMNFLVQANNGQWFAIAASWNDSAARVDEPRFVALMTRALNLMAQDGN